MARYTITKKEIHKKQKIDEKVYKYPYYFFLNIVTGYDYEKDTSTLGFYVQLDDNTSFPTVLSDDIKIPFEAEEKFQRNDKISESLNKFDFYETLLDDVIEEYQIRQKELKGKEYEKSHKDILHCTYFDLIHSIIDKDYITFDMAVKLYKNDMFNAAPKKFDEQDFKIDFDDEEEIMGLKNKYRKEIKNDEVRYIEEEKRSLNFEKERIDKEYEQALLQTASLTTQRNKINERIRKIG